MSDGIKRYEPDMVCSQEGGSYSVGDWHETMEESPTGSFVSYSDHLNSTKALREAATELLNDIVICEEVCGTYHNAELSDLRAALEDTE